MGHADHARGMGLLQEEVEYRRQSRWPLRTIPARCHQRARRPLDTALAVTLLHQGGSRAPSVAERPGWALAGRGAARASPTPSYASTAAGPRGGPPLPGSAARGALGPGPDPRRGRRGGGHSAGPPPGLEGGGGPGRRGGSRGPLEGRRPLVPLHRVPGRRRPHAHAQPPHREGTARLSLATAVLTDSVKALALELGFDLVTAGPATPPEHGPALRHWLEAGHAGTMGYLERRVEERLDPARVLPRARSVPCVALNYFQAEPADPSLGPVARYAWGRDYHDVIGPRLERLPGPLRP